MKVLLSSGQGPLYFPMAAKHLSKVVDRVEYVCGYIPSRGAGPLLWLVGKIRGKDVQAAARRHCIPCDAYIVHSCFFTELFNQLILAMGRFLPSVAGRMSLLPWKLAGYQCRRYMKNCDVFHVRSGGGHGGAIMRAKEFGLKVLVDHSIAHPQFMEDHLRPEYEKYGATFSTGISSPFWQMIDEDCRWGDLIVVNSDFVKETFVSAGYAPNKVRVVYLGVRDDFFGARQERIKKTGDTVMHANKPLRLVFIGGFGFRKGGEYLLESMRLLKNRGVQCTLDVVGDYKDFKDVIDKYAKENLPIIFHGSKPYEQLRAYLSEGDVFVFPSIAEGCAQTGMEALGAGMCVVATRESGFPITDGQDGYYVPAKDSGAIADRIAWLDNHRADLERTAARAAKLIKGRFTWENYAQNMAKVYRELQDLV